MHLISCHDVVSGVHRVLKNEEVSLEGITPSSKLLYVVRVDLTAQGYKLVWGSVSPNRSASGLASFYINMIPHPHVPVEERRGYLQRVGKMEADKWLRTNSTKGYFERSKAFAQSQLGELVMHRGVKMCVEPILTDSFFRFQ